MSKFPPNYNFRLRLLQISEQLEMRDVKKLSYLCTDVVPRSQAKDITDGIDLFAILEERGYLSPRNTAFLYRCLHDIGKPALGESLLVVPRLPRMPDSLHSHRQLTIRFRDKARWSIQTLAEIELINKEEMKNVCGEVHLALSEDLPVPLWQPDESASLSIDKVVSATLRSLFLYTKSQLEAIKISGNEGLRLNRPVQECEVQFKVLEDELDRIGWNSKVREKVKEKDSQGERGQLACQNIREMCTNLLGSEAPEIDGIIHRVESYICAINYTRHSIWQVPLTYQWLINLLLLARVSVLDLSKHRELLSNLLSQERESITSNYETLVQFVGEDTLEKLQLVPQLQSSSGSNTALVMGWPISRQIFLIQFASLAMGYRINPMEMWGKYSKIAMCKEMVENRIQTYVNLSANVKSQMLQDLHKLRQRAIDFTFYDHNYAGIEELLPEPTNSTDVNT